jgi:glycerate dehydrogenase
VKIVVLDGRTLNPGDNPWDQLAELGELSVYDRTAPDEVTNRASGAGILLTNKTPLPEEILGKLPALQFIAVLATGYNVVDVRAARSRGIPVSNVPTYGTESVAQHTMALLLELCHRVGLHDQSVRDGEWSRSPDFCYWKSPLLELPGKTLGIIGYGRIGRQVAKMAKAFRMDVVYLQRDGAIRTETDARGVPMEQFVREADVISLHCALSPANTGFVNRDWISKLKPGALLLNTGRGALLNEKDVAEALQEGRLGGAALDVLAQEPPPEKHPLFQAPRCILTPHMAWTGIKARRTLMKVTTNNVRAFLAGQPVNVVN